MIEKTADLADRLLDAQVAWAIGELTGDRLVQVLTRDVDDLLATAARLRLDEVVDAEAVKVTARRVAELPGAGELVAELAEAFVTAVHELPEAADSTPADLVEREDVEALVTKLLAMHSLHKHGLDRTAQSPLVGVVASKFVTKIVSDVVAQNRERAEKLPGVSSLFSLGTSAANKARSLASPMDALLGDAAGRSAQYAIRRTNAALLELVRDAPLHGAAMEIWDLQAAEPLSDLRRFLTAKDARELIAIVHRLLVSAAGSEYVAAAIDACIDVFFDTYGSKEVATLLVEAGVSRDDLVDLALRHAPPVLEALHAGGDLDTIIRSRLAPFFASDAVRSLLDGAATRPRS